MKGNKKKATGENVTKAGLQNGSAEETSGKKRQRDEGSKSASRKKRWEWPAALNCYLNLNMHGS